MKKIQLHRFNTVDSIIFQISSDIIKVYYRKLLVVAAVVVKVLKEFGDFIQCNHLQITNKTSFPSSGFPCQHVKGLRGALNRATRKGLYDTKPRFGTRLRNVDAE